MKLSRETPRGQGRDRREARRVSRGVKKPAGFFAASIVCTPTRDEMQIRPQRSDLTKTESLMTMTESLLTKT